MKNIFIASVCLLLIAGCVKERTQPTRAASPVIGDTVIHFWNFNNGDSSSRAASISMVPGATFRYYAQYIDFTGGSLLNLFGGADSGYCLRVRNPADSLVFKMPTTGYDSVTLRFAVRRSNSGPTQNALSYTTDGVTYTTKAIGANVYDVDTLFNVENYILSQDPAINNNPNFGVKIVFLNVTPGSTSGNGRFDNVMLRGKKR
jgi:hypothetical protein